jgi:hypothetical protein
MSSGQMSFWANVAWANVSGQMSYGQTSWNPSNSTLPYFFWVVTHPSTIQANHCLTLVIKWVPVCPYMLRGAFSYRISFAHPIPSSQDVDPTTRGSLTYPTPQPRGALRCPWSACMTYSRTLWYNGWRSTSVRCPSSFRKWY